MDIRTTNFEKLPEVTKCLPCPSLSLTERFASLESTVCDFQMHFTWTPAEHAQCYHSLVTIRTGILINAILSMPNPSFSRRPPHVLKWHIAIWINSIILNASFEFSVTCNFKPNDHSNYPVLSKSHHILERVSAAITLCPISFSHSTFESII